MESTNLLESIKAQLITDLMAAELKWCWFRAALFSFKRNFLVRPFPPAFRKNGLRVESVSSTSVFDDDDSKDFEKLIAAASTMPPIFSLLNDDDNNGLLQTLSMDQLQLLAWVMNTEKYYNLSTANKQMFEQIKKLTGQQHVAKVPEPDYVFRVDYDIEAETRFHKRRGDRKTVFAYHGSRLPNFYSIVRNGLRSNLNQVSAFGEGTYLSPELSVSLNWSPMSSINSSNNKPSVPSNGNTLEGARMSCIAVCEVIDDPTGGGVSRCECSFDANSSAMGNSTSSSRRGNNGVPDRYILVKNDDLLRIRYILAYVDKSSIKRDADERAESICHRMAAFCSQHRFWLIMLAYFALLAAVGLINSSNFQWYVRRFWSSSAGEYGYIDSEYPGENFHHSYEDT